MHKDELSQPANDMPSDAARARVEALLLEGLRSGPATPMTPQDWEDIRREIRARWVARTREETRPPESGGRS
jgi:hypothetical protein